MDADPFERAKALFFEGHALFEAGRPAEAAERFEASLALVPGRASTLANLGAARVEAGRWGEALAPLEQALDKDPGDLASRSYRGAALAALGRHAEALACHDAVLARAPERAGNWFRRGQALQHLEHHDEALDAYTRAVTLDPTLAPAWMQQGNLLRDAGRLDAAAHAFEQALAHGGDAQLNGYFLASITGKAAPGAAPPAYVEPFFDEYAATFEHHLVETLGYRAPDLLVDAMGGLGSGLRAAEPERMAVSGAVEVPGGARARAEPRYRSALDLGCGTGLCGPLLRPLSDRLEGVDLSGGMLERARARGVYDELVQADVAVHLAATPRRHDLVVATDVFIYIGDLEAVFAGVARVLEPGGLFAFTVESHAGAGPFALLPSLRYAHAENYVQELADRHRFEVLQLVAAPLREEQGRPVHGLYAVLRR